ncbi:radical SAM additional 4Fe4S-binding domain protein [Desulfosporosinus orientis DSM 765]|uniref:Radical SAM additional 4Fe4S-binding domain protein n=1 Tax=Desulfosporosinus orientis (strain ATCC 19365 / DSM 765 / NCIMB 8382 / VKM B-1628 / Singapore I) TaxID=768706 RepID=G7W6T4_DESOD|nr:radical SAM protein [Desulfosporosinus orientis]AET69216.1 radical SAM additional 4Fe4S-binding domain protein [Desulfosporosinus orientis DSM 765]
MNGRFARLKEEWLLRGWSDVPWALVNWRNGDFRELNRDGYYVAQSCDGQTDFDSLAFLPRHREILNKLITAGLVEACAGGEKSEAVQDYRRAPNPVIRGLLWSITGRCNLKCRHCFMEAPSGRFGDFTLEQIKGMIRQLEEANVQEVALTGGEPFMRRDLPEIIRILSRKKIGLAEVFSNGMLITDEILETIMQYGYRPFFKISFDGCNTHDYMRGVSGSEAKTIEGIKRLKVREFPVTIITSVDQITRRNLLETYDMLRDLAVDGWWLAPPVEIGHWRGQQSGVSLEDMVETSTLLMQRWLADNRPFDLKLWRFGLFPRQDKGAGDESRSVPGPITPDSWNCGGTHSRPYLLPDGTLLPCGGYTGTGLLEKMPNVLRSSLSKAWSDPELRSICDLKKKDVLAQNEGCTQCGFFGECGAGCRVVALTETGDLLAKEPIACKLFHGGYIRRFREMVEAGSYAPGMKTDSQDCRE